MGGVLSSKLSKVLKRNPRYAKMKDVAVVLQREEITGELPWGPKAVASMKYVPVTSCCVERTFSRYKNVLRDNRKCFTTDNLELYIVVHCNSSFLKK